MCLAQSYWFRVETFVDEVAPATFTRVWLSLYITVKTFLACSWKSNKCPFDLSNKVFLIVEQCFYVIGACILSGEDTEGHSVQNSAVDIGFDIRGFFNESNSYRAWTVIELTYIGVMHVQLYLWDKLSSNLILFASSWWNDISYIYSSSKMLSSSLENKLNSIYRTVHDPLGGLLYFFKS